MKKIFEIQSWHPYERVTLRVTLRVIFLAIVVIVVAI